VNLLQRLRQGSRSIVSVEDYLAAVNSFTYQGNGYAPAMTQSWGAGASVEQVRTEFAAYAQSLYGNNSVVFSLMAVRQLAFSAVRFQWQRYQKGRPGELFSDPKIRMLEVPWAGGTTGDLLAKMIADADLAGNSYWTIVDNEMVRLRPDWVDICLMPRGASVPDANGTFSTRALGMKKVGYVYWEGGRGNGDPVPLLPEDVCHFAPLTDPLATYRGMSWLTPLLRELAADQAITEYQNSFFAHGATPNMVIKHDPAVTPEDAKRFKMVFDAEYGGSHNAGKTLHLGGGADIQVVGADFKALDMKAVRGHGEVRIAAAAGVPPIIPGFVEGLNSATYSNYGQALRRFSGLTMHPLWQSAAGSLQQIMDTPAGCRLWYDTRDVEFLRDDSHDLAEVQQTQAATISSHISAGFTPESAVAAVRDDDLSLLRHTGLVSVQLWTPGQTEETDSEEKPKPDDDDDAGNGGGAEPDALPPQEQGVY